MLVEGIAFYMHSPCKGNMPLRRYMECAASRGKSSLLDYLMPFVAESAGNML